ncbi:NAD(P)H-binding protein [Avibacterium volantium]
MKVAVIGANGKAGRLIVAEAVARGLEVTAVVRGENHSATQQVLKKICLV